MLDSGLAPNVCDVTGQLPKHSIRESKAQRRGVKYVTANGGDIPNIGETTVVHRDELQGDFNFVFQHAPGVHAIILSVRKLVNKGCRVSFRKGGGTIRYSDGRKLKFVERMGVFFVPLNILDPDVLKDSVEMVVQHSDRPDEPAQGFVRQVRSP